MPPWPPPTPPLPLPFLSLLLVPTVPRAIGSCPFPPSACRLWTWVLRRVAPQKWLAWLPPSRAIAPHPASPCHPPPSLAFSRALSSVRLCVVAFSPAPRFRDERVWNSCLLTAPSTSNDSIFALARFLHTPHLSSHWPAMTSSPFHWLQKTPARPQRASVMDKACLCIDLEGFHFQQHGFVCRELGFCDWTRQHSGVRHFNPPLRFDQLTPKDKATVCWVTRNIHGLSYFPPFAIARPPTLLDPLVQALYEHFRTDTRDTVVFKGGHVEKDLLTRLGIPHLDLEAHGCPPFRKMTRLDHVKGCGYHADPDRHHCPQVECHHFVDWMMRHSTPTGPLNPP